MISWIQKYFQTHFRIIFTVLLGVLIISFVFTIGAAPGIGDAQHRGLTERQFFGYNLASQRDQERLMGDAGLSANLRVGPFAGLDAAQIQNYAFQRAAALHLASEWGVPAATSAEIEAQVKTLRMFAGQDGQFDPKAYQNFRDSLKTNPRGATEADIARVLNDDVRAEKVNNLLAGPGYVLPADVKSQVARADTSWTLATAAVNYAAFNPEIKPGETDLTQFFEQAGGRYDIQPRLVVSYLDFPVSDFLSKVTVTDAEVRAHFDANPARFPKPTDAKAPPPALAAIATDTSADFNAVRPQVEAALKRERAQRLADKNASDISLALFEAKANSPAALETFLASRNLKAQAAPAFSREAAPAELGSSPAVAAEAFRLNQDRLVSDAISTPNGAVILIWRETQPTRRPLFAEVRDRVQADFIENEKRKRFVEAGRKAKSQIEARLKAGDTFDQAAAAASSSTGLKLDTKTLTPFTLRNRPADVDFTVLGTLERLGPGQVSDMAVTGEAGIFVYAVEKKAPDLTEANPAFAETRKQLASYTSRLGSSAYITEMVERELQKTEPKS